MLAALTCGLTLAAAPVEAGAGAVAWPRTSVILAAGAALLLIELHRRHTRRNWARERAKLEEERARGREIERELKQREEKYRLLFENMTTGFALHEVVCDAQGRAVDWRFLEVNPAFEQLTGLSARQIVGRTLREVMPEAEPRWIEILARVAETGEPAAFEGHTQSLGRYFDTWVFSPQRGQCAVIFSDVSETRHFEEALRAIVAGTYGNVGGEFFRSLVKHLAKAFSVRYALVAELLPDGRSARTLAAWAGEAPAEDFEYALDGTPCADIVESSACLYREDVQRLFPEDRLLAEFGAQSYCGIPLRGSSGSPLGILAVLDERPLSHSEEHALTLLQVFASRAEAEIERLRTERALRYSEERLSRLFHANPAAVVVTRMADARIIEVNERFERWSGHSRAATVGRTALELGLYADPADRTALLDEVLRTGHCQGKELAFRTKRGSAVVGHVSAELLPLDGQPHMLTIIVDVTEHRRLEEQRAQLQRRLATVAFEWQTTFDMIDAPIFILDRTGRITRLNSAAARHAGRTYAEILGGDILSLGPREPWPTAQRLVGSAWEGRTSCTTQAYDATGDRTWSLFATLAPLDREGNDERAILMARDVTPTVRLQQSLQRTDRMSAMGTLVAGVAHEVRNPLFAISANLEVMRTELSCGRPIDESLAIVDESVQRLNRLMADLLDFGSPTLPSLSPGDLAAVIRVAVRACEPLALRARVRLRCEIPRDLPPLAMDRHRLSQVFQNLLQNAIQHSCEEGTVTVTVRELAAGTALRLECDVDDDGPGFSAEDIVHVFEPFFTRRAGGTGLGLPIAQRAVEEHGGTLSAMNRPQGGARMRVCLPAAEGPQAERRGS